MAGTEFTLEVLPKIPPRLARLEELASNLWYSWDRPTRALFARLYPALWDAVGHSPRAFLKRIDERRLVEAAEDPVFLGNYNRVLSAFDTYHEEPLRRGGSEWLRPTDLVAYFCAEFGFHESFPIYSGGLGILAGDHCKAASDLRLPFVGVGLLYRQGYFSQLIDREGSQLANYADSGFVDQPIERVTAADGSDLRVTVEMPGRGVVAQVWKARVGHVSIVLLDTDLAVNSPHDRNITHRLYGGDRTTRIEQEIVLGVGGVRALAAMGFEPTVWHINEGHAAFLVLERMRALVRTGVDSGTALEAVACNTVFTTHTPVPAGHDHFSDDMMVTYFQACCGELGLSHDGLLALGRVPGGPEFNMTALAVRGSRFHNGVSRIHGDVSARILSSLWPEIEPAENPMQYVTNGVHVPTFLAQQWVELFERYLGSGWNHYLSEPSFWDRINEIPDHLFWSVRQTLKSRMLYLIRHRMKVQFARNHGSEAHLDRVLRLADPLNPNVLTIGFARRFATYKRATLLFEDLDWFRSIVGNRERPVLFLFAGKAHPADHPGQALIRRIHEIARMPEFESCLLFIEDYDMRLARRLVTGVDVWLNNPLYPLEASGTSGMKAAVNGIINLSVLDGWWGEGYDGTNGWAIKPASDTLDEGRRNHEESRTLYELLQDQVVPLYYSRGPSGYSPDWVKMAKRSMSTLLPRFNSQRMVTDYLRKTYFPASQQGRRYSENGYQAAREIAAWKAKIRVAWPRVSARRLDASVGSLRFGDAVRVEVAVAIDGLRPQDIVVEMVLERRHAPDHPGDSARYTFEFTGTRTDAGEHVFALDLTPEFCGRISYRLRLYPCHELLTHPFEMGMMRWI